MLVRWLLNQSYRIQIQDPGVHLPKMAVVLMNLLTIVKQMKLRHILLKGCFDAYEAGCYSPKLLSSSEVEPGTIVVLGADDLNRLEFARLQVTRYNFYGLIIYINISNHISQKCQPFPFSI